MSFALTAGVTGLQAHQKMLDVAGNNLANVNTNAFKASTITFSELLSETIKKASQPTSSIGGTNPQQMGSGVGVANIMRDMSQGNIVNTGQPLDLAIEGEGYFVLNDGQQNVFTRIGAFGVDANSSLVDPATGYHIQRIGSEGELDGFQTPGVSDIHIPYDTTLPAKATTNMVVSGNLSADGATARTQLLESDTSYTYNDNAAQLDTKISELGQFSGSFAAGQTGTITITGTQRDGTALSGSNTLAVDADTTMGELIDAINALLTDGTNTFATASLTEDGKIKITDSASGYSRTDINLAYTASTGGTDKLKMPGYFEIVTPGGNEVKTVNITVVDSQGGKHTLNAAFVRTDTANTWDMVLTSITGNVSSMVDRRIEGITFGPTGAYNGLGDISETAAFGIKFAHDTSTTQKINVELGTVGNFDGITQFAGSSTAVVNKQDGYEAGRLSSLSVNNEGTVVGAFSNGIKKNIATIQIALFQNPAGLESVGNGYFIGSANSGEAVATSALNGGAGAVHGSSLEKSNVDVATEFVAMIEAQNGYQANARTIRVASDILSTLTNLIR
jgi:flagellar hook protein FlgE